MKLTLKRFPTSPGNPNDKWCTIVDELGQEIVDIEDLPEDIDAYPCYKTELATKIVRSYNSHDEILEACKKGLDALESFISSEFGTTTNPIPQLTDPTCVSMREAIANAEREV